MISVNMYANYVRENSLKWLVIQSLLLWLYGKTEVSQVWPKYFKQNIQGP